MNPPVPKPTIYFAFGRSFCFPRPDTSLNLFSRKLSKTKSCSNNYPDNWVSYPAVQLSRVHAVKYRNDGTALSMYWHFSLNRGIKSYWSFFSKPFGLIDYQEIFHLPLENTTKSKQTHPFNKYLLNGCYPQGRKYIGRRIFSLRF